jgi:trans-aconitate 2-methyltransferase
VSTATFHWIADHDGLFENLHAALVPGGQLVAQCGGAGCVDSVVEAIAAAGMTWNPWNFATAEDTSHRLQGAGFTDVRSWLHDEPAELEQGAPLREYLSTVILGSHLERLPAAEHRAFVENVASHIDPPVIDYVRLNVLARAG